MKLLKHTISRYALKYGALDCGDEVSNRQIDTQSDAVEPIVEKSVNETSNVKKPIAIVESGEGHCKLYNRITVECKPLKPEDFEIFSLDQQTQLRTFYMQTFDKIDKPTEKFFKAIDSFLKRFPSKKQKFTDMLRGIKNRVQKAESGLISFNTFQGEFNDRLGKLRMLILDNSKSSDELDSKIMRSSQKELKKILKEMRSAAPQV